MICRMELNRCHLLDLGETTLLLGWVMRLGRSRLGEDGAGSSYALRRFEITRAMEVESRLGIKQAMKDCTSFLDLALKSAVLFFLGAPLHCL